MLKKAESVIIQTYPGNPLMQGAAELADGRINFAVEMDASQECGVVIFFEDRSELKIPFREDYRYGRINSIIIDGLQDSSFEYLYYEGDEYVYDPFAKIVTGSDEWMRLSENGIRHKVRIREEYLEHYPKPGISKEEMIIYLMHVRGFTMHNSSCVNNRGTFSGITEKIPYLKELGINAVELMPSYEFEEREKNGRVNYWGFKPGYYMAPKSSYSAGNAVKEFMEMVNRLHQEKIAVIMQFYFPEWIEEQMVTEVLRYWTVSYHVDGFHIPGNWINTEKLRKDPILSDSLLLFEEEYHNGYLEVARRFLRGDEWSLFPFLDIQRKDNINYITNYCGFSLADLVSYDRKHNENNGEHNQDGEVYNYSWNCGCEGETEDPDICRLRLKQMKNAFAYLLTAQGIPMIVSGDEFGFGRGGNNNPYCQDNKINWLDWEMMERNRELLEFVKSLIRLRKESGLKKRDSRKYDFRAFCGGYPSVSWHGEEAWYLEPNKMSRHAGIMICGNCPDSGKAEFIYIAYNSDKEVCSIALPRLPENMYWKIIADTDSKLSGKCLEKSVCTAPRSTVILYADHKKPGMEIQ